MLDSSNMLRRNGKPRSCEPCRISKIRCDHATPKCQKCQARGMEEKCFYHPAPMTRPPGQRRQSTEPRPRVTKAKVPALSLASESPSHRTAAPPRENVVSPVTNAWPTPYRTPTGCERTPNETTRPFYLGSTSYAAVFAEEHAIPDSVHEQPRAILIATPVSPSSDGIACSRFCQFSIGPEILNKLSPFSLFERLIVEYFKDTQATALKGPLILTALPQLRRDLEELSQQTNNIVLRCAQITSTTARPMKVPPDLKARDFHTIFTGSNLRWETLGLVFIVAASSAQHMSPDDPVFILEDGRKINNQEFISDMISASNSCIQLCQVHGAVNDIMLWMLYQNMLATSNHYGDNYHGCWRRIGDTINCVFAEGIHCEETFDVPFFLREARRSLYAAVYRSDKTLATFFGRPPMLGGRYSNRKLPLDLDDDTVTSSDPVLLNDAISRLDDAGWNTEGQIWSTSWIRLRYKMAVLRERVLEHSLAGEPDANLTTKLKIISDECRLTWEAIPRHLRYDLEGDRCWSILQPGVTIRMLTVYLDHLHTEFQIQRILRRQSPAAIPALLDISMKLVTSALILNKQRNQAYTHQRHFASIILFYCLPSAGVLALELRHCTLDNKPLPGSISRADLIRTLSVFVACLDWCVLPGDGNHKLCSELNKMLTLILDEVLNYQPPANATQESDIEQANQLDFFDIPMVDGMEPIPTESEHFLNWLDNANWNNTYLF